MMKLIQQSISEPFLDECGLPLPLSIDLSDRNVRVWHRHYDV